MLYGCDESEPVAALDGEAIVATLEETARIVIALRAAPCVEVQA